MFKTTTRLIAATAVLLVLSGCALQSEAGKNLPNGEYRNHTVSAVQDGKNLPNLTYRDHDAAN